jgi:hypothetical protein
VNIPGVQECEKYGSVLVTTVDTYSVKPMSLAAGIFVRGKRLNNIEKLS